MSNPYIDHNSLAEHRLIAKELASRVMKIEKYLPEKQRVTFHLHIVDGLEMREVAKRMGISMNAARGNLFSAKKKVIELAGLDR